MSMDKVEGQDSRVFIGNVAPDTDPSALEERFQVHGKILGVIVLKGFAFVQFSEVDEAKAAIAKEHQTEFQGKNIDVKPAKRTGRPSEPAPPPAAKPIESPSKGEENGKPDQPAPPPSKPAEAMSSGGVGSSSNIASSESSMVPTDNSFRGRGRGRGYYEPRGRGRGGYYGGGGRGGGYHHSYDGGYQQQPQPSYDERKLNDCEIVCVSRNQRTYAEQIETRLRNIGLKVDVLFPNPKVELSKILTNIATRGVMFGVVVTPLNEDHNSVTLNILQGQPQEHRNMPLEDAYGLVARIFESGLEQNMAKKGEKGMPVDVRNVFGFLMDARPLSVMEYDKLIRCLVKQREDMLRSEYGDNVPANLITPPVGPVLDSQTKAKQDELQGRIMDILNKKKSELASQQAAAKTEISPSLQKAIDSLIKTGPNLLNPGAPAPAGSTISAGSAYSATGSNPATNNYLYSAYGSGSAY